MSTEPEFQTRVPNFPRVTFVSDGDSQLAVYRDGEKILEDDRHSLTAARVLEALGIPVKQVEVTPGDLSAHGNSFPESLSKLRGEEQEIMPLSGKTIVLTGTFPQSHRRLASFLQTLGAKVRVDVSERTDFLVVGDKPGDQILLRARELNVIAVQAEHFWRLIAAHPLDPVHKGRH